VVRTAAFFGPWDRHNFAWACSTRWRRRTFGEPHSFVSAHLCPELVHNHTRPAVDGEKGVAPANQGG
jgi:dTDP-4-dehydrorhamnose reductase